MVYYIQYWLNGMWYEFQVTSVNLKAAYEEILKNSHFIEIEQLWPDQAYEEVPWFSAV